MTKTKRWVMGVAGAVLVIHQSISGPGRAADGPPDGPAPVAPVSAAAGAPPGFPGTPGGVAAAPTSPLEPLSVAPQPAPAAPPAAPVPPAAQPAPVVHDPAARNVWGSVTGDRRIGVTIDPESIHTPGAPGPLPGTNPAPGRAWLDAEYLLWWVKNDNFPVLLTTGPAVQGGGVLGRPGTMVLIDGKDQLSGDARSGLRLSGGIWLDDCRTWGVDAGGFFLSPRSKSSNGNSGTNPVLTRPIFNQNSGMEDVEVATFPGTATGTVTADQSSNLWGADVNLRHPICCSCACDCACGPTYRVDGLAGIRVFGLDENLQVTEDLVGGPTLPNGQPNVLPDGTSLNGVHQVVVDRFATHNLFWGGQVGVDAGFRYNRWTLDLLCKIALGDMNESVNRIGTDTLTFPGGGVRQFVGGLLVEPSNQGHVTQDQFAVVPEVRVRGGYQVTSWLRATVGYNFLFASSIVRPGDQIDRVVDVSQVPPIPVINPATGLPFPPAPGGSRPAPVIKDTTFWTQGLDFGLEVRY